MREIHLRVPATTANVGPGYDIFAIALEEPYDEIIILLVGGDKSSQSKDIQKAKELLKEFDNE